MNVFELEKISFAYPHHSVFSEFNLTIAKGDFTAIVGGNGSGKSTFLKLCVGALKPEAGEIRIFGQRMENFREWHKIGYVPQNPLREKSFPITVEEVVALGRVAKRGIGRRLKAADYAIVARALQLVGAEVFRRKIIGDLSGGQQQRVMIARALAAQPEVLILDEPTAGIDTLGTEEFYSLLRELNETEQITIVLVAHDVDRVARYAKTILSLQQGRSYHGPAEGFFQCSLNLPLGVGLAGEAANHA